MAWRIISWFRIFFTVRRGIPIPVIDSLWMVGNSLQGEGAPQSFPNPSSKGLWNWRFADPNFTKSLKLNLGCKPACQLAASQSRECQFNEARNALWLLAHCARDWGLLRNPCENNWKIWSRGGVHTTSRRYLCVTFRLFSYFLFLVSLLFSWSQRADLNRGPTD